MKKLLFALALSVGVFAQPTSQPVRYVTSNPSGACVNGAPLRYNYASGQGKLWGCKNLVWTEIVGSGGGSTIDVDALKNAWFLTDGGTANAVTGTTTTAFPGAYALGQAVIFKANATNSGATTININSLGNKDLTKLGTTALAAGNKVSGRDYLAIYNGTQFELINFTILAADIPTLNQSTTGNAATSTGLAANPANCSAGNIPRGIDALGVAENCNPVDLAAEITGVLPTANNTVNVLNDSVGYCADAGSTDTYACSLSPVPGAYVSGARYRFKANTVNTGAASINFNSLGAKTIVKVAGGVTTDLADNDIRAGQVVELAYDGTNMQIQSLLGNAPPGGSGCTVGGSSGDLQKNNGSSGCNASNLNQNADGSLNASKAVTTPAPSAPTYNAGGTTTCDLSASNVCAFTTGAGNTTLAVTNPHGSGLYVLRMTQGATPRTVTYPASFSSGDFCPITPVASKITTIFFAYDGSANYYALSCGTTEAGLIGAGPEGPVITSTASGEYAFVADSTAHTALYYANGSGNRHAIPRVASGDQVQVSDLSDAATVPTKAAIQAGGYLYLRSTTGNDTYVAGLTPALTAYARGQCFNLDPDTANTGTATINIDSLGAKSILNLNGGALLNGDLAANKPALICYDGTQFILQGGGIYTAVTPGTYGDATNVPQVTVDAKGRVTSVTNVAITGGGGGTGVGRTTLSPNFSSAIADGACDSKTSTWTGVTTSDTVIPGWPSSLAAGLQGIIFVSAADTVTSRLCNISGAPITPGSLSVKATLAIYNLSGSDTINFSSIPDGGCASSTFALTGVAASDPVTPKWPSALEAGLHGTMIASATDTIQVRLCNSSGAPLDPASASFGASVAK